MDEEVRVEVADLLQVIGSLTVENRVLRAANAELRARLGTPVAPAADGHLERPTAEATRA